MARAVIVGCADSPACCSICHYCCLAHIADRDLGLDLGSAAARARRRASGLFFGAAFAPGEAAKPRTPPPPGDGARSAQRWMLSLFFL